MDEMPGGMDQKLEVFATFTKNLCSVPSTHVVGSHPHVNDSEEGI